MLFNHTIHDENSWADIHQRIDVFQPLIEHIFRNESLPMGNIESTMKSTNAVFKVENLIVKIFAPKESGRGSERDFQTEQFALTRALSLDASVPRIRASGIVKDKYEFPYIVIDFIHGIELSKVFDDMSEDDKYSLGRKLRENTDKLNTSCEVFNTFQVPETSLTEGYSGWLIDLGYCEKFIEERKKYIRSLDLNKNAFVFCHGDLATVNILLCDNGELYIIDFADAMLAPICAEHTIIAHSVKYDKSFLRGYFGEISLSELTDICFDGLLLSNNGVWILANSTSTDFIDGKDCESLPDLKTRLHEHIKMKL